MQQPQRPFTRAQAAPPRPDPGLLTQPDHREHHTQHADEHQHARQRQRHRAIQINSGATPNEYAATTSASTAPRNTGAVESTPNGTDTVNGENCDGFATTPPCSSKHVIRPIAGV
jgi:hypothetical protein